MTKPEWTPFCLDAMKLREMQVQGYAEQARYQPLGETHRAANEFQMLSYFPADVIFLDCTSVILTRQIKLLSASSYPGRIASKVTITMMSCLLNLK